MSSLAVLDTSTNKDDPVRDADVLRGDIAHGNPLVDVGKWLLRSGYTFTCPSPESHARVNARPQNAEARSGVDVFGWSRPFPENLLPAPVLSRLYEADVVSEQAGMLRCKVRFSTLGRHLFVHSAFPTTDRQAVFFGPDTYRFVSFVRRELASPWIHPVETLCDIGCGTGAGGILAADALGRRVLRDAVLSDINPLAVAFSRTNVEINGVPGVHCVRADGLAEGGRFFDLILSNPPYMMDAARRTYCHGGTEAGTEVSLRFLQAGLAHLAPGGRLLLYTGTPVVQGQDLFQRAAREILEAAQLRYDYTELDPDVFGEDLARPEYAAVDRIAVIGLVVRRPGGCL